MHIVHIEDFFHPDAGYQVNILAKYLVKFGHQVTVITAEMDQIPEYLTSFFGRDHIEERDRAYEEAYGVKIIRLPVWKYISGRVIFAEGLLDTIHNCNPDILYVHGNDTFTGMWATWNRKKLGCPLILDSHMLEMASENHFRKLFRLFYRVCVTPIIKREHLTVIRTQDDPYVEKCLGIPLAQAPWISYGSDTLLFHPDADVRKQFRRTHGIPEDAFVVVYAGKLDEAKGGKLLADGILKPIENAVFVIVGNTSGDYGKQVESTFSESKNRILRFPTQKYRDLAPFFQAADLAVFPRQCSMSFYDVQACGLPVLFEDNNINKERCSHQNGWTFHEGDTEDFREKLRQIIAMDSAAYQAAAAHALSFIKENYDYEKKAREYEAVLQSAVNAFQNN